MRHHDNSVTLESRHLCLAVDPACGGKLRSLISKRSGKEFFYQDTRPRFDRSKGYSYHDISGYDDCFPTVAACKGNAPGGVPYDYADHGFLWQGAWQTRTHDGVLTMNRDLSHLKCSFARRCSFEMDDTLLLEYRIVNHGGESIPYVYSAHPLLAADEQTRVVLPTGMVRAFNFVAADNVGMPNGQWFDFPLKNHADIVGPFSRSRQTFVKLFSERLKEGQAAVEYPDREEKLVLTFDTKILPYLGFLACQGFDSLGDDHFAGEFLLAFEPTTGIGDDISTCIQTNTLNVLAPGSSLSFWIRIAIEEM